MHIKPVHHIVCAYYNETNEDRLLKEMGDKGYTLVTVVPTGPFTGKYYFTKDISVERYMGEI